MPDYDSPTGAPASDPWAAPPTAPAPTYDPSQSAVNANGVPGLPVGSTGQPATPAPLGPRATPAPAPPPTPGGVAPNTPGAAPTGVGAVFQTVKDFFTGNTTVGDYKGGGTPKTSTDTSRDLGRTSGQEQHDANEKANAQSTDPKPPSWWEGLF